MSGMSRDGAWAEPASHISSLDRDHVWVRGHDLVEELMGKVSFTEMVFLLVRSDIPTPEQQELLDAVLVSLVEHGLTPSAYVSRLTYAVAPESIQGAVAAGLLGAGSLILGSMEACGRLLTNVCGDASSPLDEAARTAVDELVDQGSRVPGLGHSLHTRGDPRAEKLVGFARDRVRDGRYLDALLQVRSSARELTGKNLPINATGAIAAVLLELGIPWQLHRGFALVSRCAGLVAHIGEELEAPITPGVRAGLRKASLRDPEGPR